jgi:Na+ dependent nucleoside transporter C-terminus
VQIGGIGALVPERRNDLARLGVRAMLAGTMANLISASIAGMFLGGTHADEEQPQILRLRLAPNRANRGSG